jgi:hypothetical protein
MIYPNNPSMNILEKPTLPSIKTLIGDNCPKPDGTSVSAKSNSLESMHSEISPQSFYETERNSASCKREAKLERDRIGAKHRRQRKSQRMQYLENRVKELETEVIILRKRNQELLGCEVLYTGTYEQGNVGLKGP